MLCKMLTIVGEKTTELLLQAAHLLLVLSKEGGGCHGSRALPWGWRRSGSGSGCPSSIWEACCRRATALRLFSPFNIAIHRYRPEPCIRRKLVTAAAAVEVPTIRGTGGDEFSSSKHRSYTVPTATPASSVGQWKLRSPCQRARCTALLALDAVKHHKEP